MISGKMALRQRGADEEESIYRRADGGDPAGSGSQLRGRGGQEEQGQRADHLHWRKHFGGLAPADVKRLKTLETENARLKKLLAERDLDIEVLKDINRRKW